MSSKDLTTRLVPTAVYKKELHEETTEVHLTPGNGPHSTNGKTTGPSEYVLNAGMDEDQDKSSEPIDTNLGAMRAELTSLQDNINVFLTNEMKKSGGEEKDIDLDKVVADVESGEDD